jgi:voltage-gated potassium channel
MFSSHGRFRHVGRGLLLLVLVIAMGVGGLMAIEGYPFLDALYMTIITISTVGFQEVHKLSDRGHLLVIFLIVTGLSVMTYTLGAFAQIIIEGQFRQLLGRRRMQREVEALKGHYIVCGYGRMGQLGRGALRRGGGQDRACGGDPQPELPGRGRGCDPG